MINKLAQIDIGKVFSDSGGGPTSLASVGSLTSNLIVTALSVAGIILLVYLIVGGIGMISGAGTNNPEKAAKGKQAATSALIGFLVVFAAYWIVQLIEIFTGANLLGN